MFRRSLSLVAPLAAATAVGLALATPSWALGGDAADPLELAQASPPAATPAPPATPERRAERPAPNPRAMCLDQVARRAGNRTFLKVRLELKPEQMTAWTAFAKVSDEADAKDLARCATLPTEVRERPGYLDRLGFEEAVMKARIERIEAVKPALKALYDGLTPEQKVVLDQPRPPSPMMGPMMGSAAGMMHHHGPR